MALRVVRGTLDMDGVTPDANGDVFTVYDIVGWDTPTVEMSVHATMTTGSVITHARLSHLSLVLRGQARSPLAADTPRIRRKIANAFGATAGDVQMFVYWDINQYVYVRRAPGEGPRFSKPAKNAPVLEFEVPLVAVNPTKTAF